MNLSLFVNNSEKNKLEKNLSNEIKMTGQLREQSSIVSPSIMIRHDNPSNFNYAYIPEFKRYYFITDITSIRNGLWEVTMHVDVLMSFKDGIKNTSIILSDTETTGQTNYMSGEQWATEVKNTTTIKMFPHSLPTTGKYILITAGGQGSKA